MILKSVFMFSLFFLPYLIMFTGFVVHPLITLVLWITMGIGMAGIGLNIMHDANHGAFSSKRRINKFLSYSMNIIGANAEIWKIQHNELHHVYTNIHGVDDDIDTPSFLRFSPYTKLRRLHRFQFLYVWFFYSISTIFWITTKEFMQLMRYRQRGLIQNPKKFRYLLSQLIGWKVFYYIYLILIPLLFMPITTGQFFVGFFTMHIVAGLVISLIFQPAHVMPYCEYQRSDEGIEVPQDWAIHEMRTTNNFAQESKFFTWFVGGLNYQIEHHLFPQICHVHYNEISKIVKETALEFGIKYNQQKTFLQAIRLHTSMLYKLGRN